MTAVHEIDGILLLSHSTLWKNAATVTDHIGSFSRHSRFPVIQANTDIGFPPALEQLQFRVVVLHYSLFAPWGYLLDERYRAYLASTKAYKIAFFQDEHHYCRQRFAFLDEYGIDCVYTMLEAEHVPAVYGAHTKVSDVVSHLPGYVSGNNLHAAERFAKPAHERNIDVGYRGRPLLPYMGRAAREKYDIAIRFRERASSLGLTLDIAGGEEDRVYGDAWSRFIGDCRGFLGTESGVSVFDLDDTIREEYERLAAERPGMTAEEYFELRSDDACEERIPYRTASPRHFEAAAFRTAQILYEGRYSGIMEPWVHYIPLRKDFANFDDVIRAFRDSRLREEITSNAHRDLIASGAYGYDRFIADFDRQLEGIGVRADRAGRGVQSATAALRRDLTRLHMLRRVRHTVYTADAWEFPGRSRVVSVAGPVLKPAVDRVRAWLYPSERRGESEV
jgi:hypothetical protein